MTAPAWRNKFGILPVRILRRGLGAVKSTAYRILCSLPHFHFLDAYHGKQAPITLEMWMFQKVLGFNREAYWGVHFTSKVVQPRQILVGIDSNPGVEPGCYIQGLGTVKIGDYTQVAANVAIVSGNHDVYDLDHTVRGTVEIGSYCWLGANSVVLPGVKLGDFTIVGAGAVVTRSFEDGYCVIGGNPAKKIRDLDPERCIRKVAERPYVGYLRAQDFQRYRKDFLWV